MPGCGVQFHDPAVLVILRSHDDNRVLSILAPQRPENSYLAVGIAFSVFFKFFRIFFNISRYIFNSRNIAGNNLINGILLRIENEGFGCRYGGFSGLIPTVVPEPVLPRAYGYEAVSYNISGIAGPALDAFRA